MASAIMRNSSHRPAHNAAAMLDPDAVATILSQHFPAAAPVAVRHAAEDVLLLELLARDVGVVWEDAMRDEADPVNMFDAERLVES